jgi:hypothetical protein
MQINFIYSSSPNISELDPDEVIKQSLQIPDEVQHLIGVQERVRAIGKYAGELTQAFLHISCSGLGIKNELMNHSETVDDNFYRLFVPNATILYFSRGLRRKQKRVLIIYLICHYFSFKNRVNEQVSERVLPDKFAC